jgi:uncharacterized protein
MSRCAASTRDTAGAAAPDIVAKFTRGGPIVPLDRSLLEILACPKCRKPLTLVKNDTAFKCGECHRVYAIVDDVPDMLIDNATIEP